MCNNILANKITKKEVNTESKEIKDNIFYDRPIISKNIVSKSLRTIENGKISYRKGHPLKLGDGSRVYEVYSSPINEEQKEVRVVFSFNGKNKRETTTFIRKRKDSMLDVEEYLLHAFSVYELRNIDLRY